MLDHKESIVVKSCKPNVKYLALHMANFSWYCCLDITAGAPAGSTITLHHAVEAAQKRSTSREYVLYFPSSIPLGSTSKAPPSCRCFTYPLEVHLQHTIWAANQKHQQAVDAILTLWRYISSMPLGQHTSSTSKSAMLRFNRNRFVDDLAQKRVQNEM